MEASEFRGQPGLDNTTSVCAHRPHTAPHVREQGRHTLTQFTRVTTSLPSSSSIATPILVSLTHIINKALCCY